MPRMEAELRSVLRTEIDKETERQAIMAGGRRWHGRVRGVAPSAVGGGR